MFELKYADLIDSSTTAYRIFEQHNQSLKRREEQLEREKSIVNGLIMKMQKLGTITYEQYNAVIALMNNCDLPWYEILELVFEDDK